MKFLLPIPTAENIPPFEGSKPLTDMLDREYLDWYSKTVGIDRLKEPVRAPSAFLNVMGEMLAADLQDADDDRTRRLKIYLAQDVNRRRGMWLTVKPLIDAICGGDAQFSYVLVAGGSEVYTSIGIEPTTDPESWENVAFNYVQGTSNDIRGLRLTGVDVAEAAEAGVEKGSYLIDVDNASLTYDDVERLKLTLQGQICAYFRVMLGYTVSDTFYPYGNGEIHGPQS